MSDEVTLSTVAAFSSIVEAEIAQNALEAEGIRSFVIDGEIGNMVWTLVGAVGGVKIQVSRSDFLAAERVLNNRHLRSRDLQDDYGLDRLTSITAKPEVVREEQDGKFQGEDSEPLPNEADRTVDRAMKAAIFGVFLFPLLVYSLILLLGLSELKSAVSPKKRLRLYGTLVFVLLMMLGAIVFLYQFSLMTLP